MKRTFQSTRSRIPAAPSVCTVVRYDSNGQPVAASSKPYRSRTDHDRDMLRRAQRVARTMGLQERDRADQRAMGYVL